MRRCIEKIGAAVFLRQVATPKPRWSPIAYDRAIELLRGQNAQEHRRKQETV
jgi:hypothetical protein